MRQQEGKMDKTVAFTGFGNKNGAITKKSNCFLKAGSVSETIW
jgi:hypothetical protein